MQLLTVHLLLQSACHTLMLPDSTNPQHDCGHFSSRFQGPYKEKNNMPKTFTICLSSELKFLKQYTEPSVATENLAHYYLNQVKVSYYPQTSNISWNMQLTCILLFHKMCV